MTVTDVSPVTAHGSAQGGSAVFSEAARLWMSCAIGGAGTAPDEVPNVRLDAAVAAFECTVAAIAKWWNYQDEPGYAEDGTPIYSDRSTWRAEAFDALADTAAALLAECHEEEGSNASNAGCKRGEYGEVILYWDGTFTKGRFIELTATREAGNENLMVILAWDTATGHESNYLGLPSLTDEADKPESERREGGWCARVEIEDDPAETKGRWVPGMGPNGFPGWLGTVGKEAE